MVPTAIVRKAKAAGLDMIGICDHNATQNATAVRTAGEELSVAVLGGIEITSREEVHVLGLFDGPDALARIQSVVDENLPGDNDEAAFGSQTIVDARDRVLGRHRPRLIGATELALEDVVRVVHDCGGLAIASHIDRQRFSVIGQLGFIPPGLALDAVEVSRPASARGVSGLAVIASSDAHRLAEIGKVTTSFLARRPCLSEVGKALRAQAGRKAFVNMEDLSLHILDIVENAVAASASRVRIAIAEDTAADRLSIEVRDNGRGMDRATREKVLDPFHTTRTTRRVGLGLPLLAQAAGQAGGTIEINSEPGQGTTVRAVFQRSHPDLQPLGDLAETLKTLLVGHPDLELQFEYTKDAQRIAGFDSSQSPDEE